MKKTIIALSLLGASYTTKAQEQPILKNGWFNHLDVSFTIGTSGLGFDFATPISEWARLRVGGVFSPPYRYDATFNMEVSEGLLTEEQDERFNKLAKTMQTLTGKTPSRTVEMEGHLKMNNFKMLIDVFPFKEFRKLHFTVGFYYGNDIIVDARNSPESARNLEGVTAYNAMYRKALAKESLIDMEAFGVTNTGGATFETANQKLRYWGACTNGSIEKGYNKGDVPSEINQIFGIDPEDNRFYAEYTMSLPLGTATHDIIAEEDIYYDYTEVLDNPYYIDDGNERVMVQYRTDDNGRIKKKGEIRYRKGEVIRKAGEALRFTPDESNTVSTSVKTNKFKPYIGAGFNTSLTKDKRTNVSIDAGITFWGGKPSVNINCPVGVDAEGNTVYYNVNLVKDVENLPNKIAKYVNLVKKFPIFPEISLRISQRLW